MRNHKLNSENMEQYV